MDGAKLLSFTVDGMDTSKYQCPRNLVLTKDLKAKDSNLTSVVNHSLCKIVSMLKGHCLYN